MSSKIYIHYTDKTLILDSSSNLMYPLAGSLLRWNNLRAAFAISITQSPSDDNAGFTNVESLPLVGGSPILNRVSIGIKSRGLELPGDSACSFAGLSNHSTSDGSALGFVGSTIILSTRDVVSFPLTLVAPGIGGYAITSTPTTVPLASPYNDQGLFYSLPTDMNADFNGKTVQIASPVANGDTSVSLKASTPTTIFSADRFGTVRSQQINPNISLGVDIGASSNKSQSTIPSKCLGFPASAVMQGSSNYATILIVDFVTTNRGTPSQTMKVGYQFVPNIGDTSIANMEAMMAAYTPTFESSVLPFGIAMPSTLFVRWPFTTTRLRIHSMTAKKFH